MATHATEAPLTIVYAPPDEERRRMMPWIFIPLVLIPLIWIPIPAPCRSPESANRMKDASNLRQIGQAMSQYAIDFHGQYPDRLQTLLLTENVTARMFVSPLANDSPAEGATPQATVASMVEGGHLSYTYVGQSLTATTVLPEHVVAYGPPGSGQGRNILCGDGDVEWFAGPRLIALLDRLAHASGPTTMP